MVIDSKGNVFEERRKKDRRQGEERRQVCKNVSEEKRIEVRRKTDRRDPKNAYRP